MYEETVYEGRQAGLTTQQVEQMVEQRMQAFQHEQVVTQYEQEIEQTLIDAGYDPNGPLAVAAITAAQNRSDLDLNAAIADIENQILQQAQSIVSRRQNPSAGMPSAAPSGGVSPQMNPANMTSRDKAMARLNQSGI